MPVKEPTPEDRELLLGLPRQEFMRAFWVAEGLLNHTQVPAEESEAAGRVWEAFVARQRNLHFGPVETPTRPIMGKSQSGRSRLRWFAAAALLILGVSIGFASIPLMSEFPAISGISWVSRSVHDVSGGIEGHDTGRIEAPALIHLATGSIELHSGSVQIGRSPGGKYSISTAEAHADIRFQSGASASVLHPLLELTITGTEFSIDLEERQGSVYLTEGGLNAVHLPDTPEPNRVEMQAPHRLIFDGPRLYSISLSPARAGSPEKVALDPERASRLRRERDSQPDSALRTDPDIRPERDHVQDSQARSERNNPPETTRFEQPGIDTAHASDNRPLQRFTLRSGEVHYGYVITRSADGLLVETQAGARVRIRLPDLVSADVIP